MHSMVIWRTTPFSTRRAQRELLTITVKARWFAVTENASLVNIRCLWKRGKIPRVYSMLSCEKKRQRVRFYFVFGCMELPRGCPFPLLLWAACIVVTQHHPPYYYFRPSRIFGGDTREAPKKYWPEYIRIVLTFRVNISTLWTDMSQERERPASNQNQDRQFHPMESFVAIRHIMLAYSDDYGTSMVQPQSKSRTVLEIVMLTVLIGWNKTMQLDMTIRCMQWDRN